MEYDRKVTTNDQRPLAEGYGRVRRACRDGERVGQLMLKLRRRTTADVEASPANSWEPINGICGPGGQDAQED